MRISEEYIHYTGELTESNSDAIAQSLLKMGERGLLLFGESQDIPPLSFERRSDYRIGRDNGSDRLYFGDLGNMPVAIKRMHPDDLNEYTGETFEQKIVNDYSVTCKLNQSAAPTLEMLGIVKNYRSFGVITKFEENIESFDRVLWQSQTPSRDEIEHALYCAAMSAAAMHSNGIRHGDYCAQNTAQDKVTRQARVIDTTIAHFTSNIEDSRYDLWSYITTLNSTDLGVSSSHVKEADVQQFLLDPYAEMTQNMPSGISQSKHNAMISNIRNDVADMLRAY